MRSSSLFLKKKRRENLSRLSFYKRIMGELSVITPFAEYEAREIIYEFWGKSMGDFLADEQIIEKDIIKRVWNIIETRKKGIPLSYITKKAYFWDMELYIEEGILIPRNDTEILLAEVLRYPKGKVLEIGTGSGAIAIALARKGFSVIATDISNRALVVARKNAEKFRANVRFLKASFFNNIVSNEKFDYIVSNPPYVSYEEYKVLPDEVKMEPKDALVSPMEGLWHSLKIMIGAMSFLKRGGMLFLEISPHRAEAYRRTALSLGYTEVELSKDLNGNFRVLKTRWK